MPDRDPPMTQIVRVVVRDAGGLAGAGHRLVGGCLRDPAEHLAVGHAILERAGVLDRFYHHSGRYTQRAWSRFVADRGSRSRSPARSTSPQRRCDGLAEP